jgi:hypothetical protein
VWLPLAVTACGLNLAGLENVSENDPTAPPSAEPAHDAAPAEGAPPAEGGPDAVAQEDAPALPPVDAGHDTAPPPSYPKSCADVPSADGQDVTLYWDGDPTKPYDAHCLAGGATYVLLNDTSGGTTSTYPLGTANCTRLASGQTKSVTTTWTMLRFDPTTKLVDTGDYAGATSAGGTHETSGNGSINNDYLKMPFASGRNCDQGGGSATVATIDLTKTKLGVSGVQAWSQDGFQGNESVTADGKRKKLSLKIAGYSAGVSPCAPNADYYTLSGGKCLTLVYAP